MATLTGVLKEIDDVTKLARMRQVNGDMIGGLIESIATKIGTIATWDTGYAVAIATRVMESELTHEWKTILQNACDDRTSTYTAGVGSGRRNSSGAPPRDQTMRHMYNYFTGMDWGVIDDKHSTPSQRDNVVTSRLGKLGVRRASEDGLIKWGLVIIQNAEFNITGTWPTYWNVYERVQTLKELLHGMPPYRGTLIDKYPEHPRDLPESMFKDAYDTTDPPVSRHIPRYEALAKHVPLRKSSKLLKEADDKRDQLAMVQAARASQPQLMLDNNTVTVNGIPINILGNHGFLGGNGGTNSSWNNNWSSWGNYGGNGARKTPMLGDRPSPDDSFSPSPRDGPRATDSQERTSSSPVIETAPLPNDVSMLSSTSKNNSDPKVEDVGREDTADIEEKAYQALLKKHTAAKNNKKVMKVAKGVMKKPAAPLGKGVKMDYVIKWDSKDKVGKANKNTFCSLHYGRAKTHFKHLSGNDFISAVQAVYRNAGIVWDKHAA